MRDAYFKEAEALRCTTRSLRGYSLIEISIGLLIIGVLTGGALKGMDLLETAKIRSDALRFQEILQSIQNYRDTFGVLPGDDPAATRYPNTPAGNGDARISGEDCALVWRHLSQAKMASSSHPPASQLGGQYSVETDPMGRIGHWVVLSKAHYASLLTPLQAQKLKGMLDGKGAAPDEGNCIIQEGQDDLGQYCLREGQLNLRHTKPACLAMVSIP
jgi:prepilin-type N-terminal cleavage/methylation domain-containing protein